MKRIMRTWKESTLSKMTQKKDALCIEIWIRVMTLKKQIVLFYNLTDNYRMKMQVGKIMKILFI